MNEDQLKELTIEEIVNYVISGKLKLQPVLSDNPRLGLIYPRRYDIVFYPENGVNAINRPLKEEEAIKLEKLISEHKKASKF